MSQDQDDTERFINYIKGLPGRTLADILLPDADYYEALVKNATDDSLEPTDEESEHRS